MELSDTNFLVVSVAFDSGGKAAAEPWIRAANPTYPCLIDEHHRVVELYDMVNVPMAAWIDEEGTIVRPPEPAGAGDAFRQMDRTKFTMPDEARASLARRRRGYFNALRDWARNGSASRFVLSPDQVLDRLKPASDEAELAVTNFRMGQYLDSIGQKEAGAGYLAEAVRLRPESWSFRRQALALDEPAKAGGPDFWAAVDALGDELYYPLTDIPDEE